MSQQYMVLESIKGKCKSTQLMRYIREHPDLVEKYKTQGLTSGQIKFRLKQDHENWLLFEDFDHIYFIRKW
jgi:hypothetical protein